MAGDWDDFGLGGQDCVACRDCVPKKFRLASSCRALIERGMLGLFAMLEFMPYKANATTEVLHPPPHIMLFRNPNSDPKLSATMRE